MRSIEMTGKTVEDAVKAGLRELGCDSSEVTIDVLHMGSPGLFGMFGKLAKVRLTVKEEDPALDFDLSDISLSLNKPGKSAPKAKPERKAEEKKVEVKPVEAPKAEEPKNEAPQAEEKKAEKPVEEEKPAAEAKPVREKAEKPARKPRSEEKKAEKPAPAPHKAA